MIKAFCIFHPCITLDDILKEYLQYGTEARILVMNGRQMTEAEIYHFVQAEKAIGYIYFSACDNRDKEGRCAGHK